MIEDRIKVKLLPPYPIDDEFMKMIDEKFEVSDKEIELYNIKLETELWGSKGKKLFFYGQSKFCDRFVKKCRR